jgi:carbon monoxide dehydrogenase subunit G
VEFENQFSVNAPIGEVYDALLDIERVAPAMPGAKVLEKTSDDAYKVSIKVKLGPVTMTYRGDVTIVDRNPAQHSAVLDVKAKEARGQGTANANVSLALEPADGEGTRGTMKTTVQLSGKAAAMSRGVIDDVSKRLVEQFAQNLEGIVGTPEPLDEVTEEAATSEPQPAPPPAQEAFDAGSLAANMAADRIREPRTAVGLVLGALFLGWLIGRRSR